MKVYCFYLIQNRIDTNKFKGVFSDDIYELNGKEIALYAFTPEKESRKYFIQTRDMDIFYEKVIEMDRKDYEEFCDENKAHLLEYHTFNTKKIIDKKYSVYMAYVLCTTVESDCILYYKEDYVFSIMSDILTDEVIEYLSTVRFKKKIRKVLDDTFLLSELINKVYPLEDINYDVLNIDEISLYVKLFSNTLKK